MSILHSVRLRTVQLLAYRRVARHVKNPWLIALLRLVLVKEKYFLYTITKAKNSYFILAWPGTSSTADLCVLRGGTGGRNSFPEIEELGL
jgi:hypothetical protein